MSRFISSEVPLSSIPPEPRPSNTGRNLKIAGALVTVPLAAQAVRFPVSTVESVTSIPGRVEAAIDSAFEQMLGPKDFGTIRKEGIATDSKGEKMGELLFDFGIYSLAQRETPIIRTSLSTKSDDNIIAPEKLQEEIKRLSEGKTSEEKKILNLDPTLSHLKGKKYWGPSYNGPGGVETTGNGGALGEWWKFTVNGEDYYVSNTYGHENRSVPPILEIVVKDTRPPFPGARNSR